MVITQAKANKLAYSNDLLKQLNNCYTLELGSQK